MRNRRKMVVSVQNPIIGGEALKVYLSGGKLMVSLDSLGLKDKEFSKVAEVCSAAGVALINEEGSVVDHISAFKADGAAIRSVFSHIKFLSAYEMGIYNKVEAELKRAANDEAVVDLSQESWVGRLERCLEEGGYVRGLDESLLNTRNKGLMVSSKWVALEELLYDSLYRIEVARREAANKRKSLPLLERVVNYLGRGGQFAVEPHGALSAH